MNRVALVLICACLSFGVTAVAPASAQSGPTTVKPRGEGPIPKGKSGVVDTVLESLGWGNCKEAWMGNSWCSPTKKY